MITQATIIGRLHRLMRQNCQDVVIGGTLQAGYAYGVVLDGCGGKWVDTAVHGRGSTRQTAPSHNELGARLLGEFINGWLASHLPAAPELETMIQALYGDCLSFLDTIINNLPFAEPDKRSRFIATHLLCTVVGFAVTPTAVIFFWAGDGYLCLDGQVITLDSDNQPDYLAYYLAQTEAQIAAAPRPAGFQTKLLLNPEACAWLAVASDGWQPAQLAMLVDPRSDLELQRWLNLEAQKRGSFEDDGAIAIWHQAAVGSDRMSEPKGGQSGYDEPGLKS
jgi:hypothetical protein